MIYLSLHFALSKTQSLFLRNFKIFFFLKGGAEVLVAYYRFADKK